MTLPLFCVAKKKRETKEKIRVSRQELLKGGHQGQNVTILVILETQEFKKCSCFLTFHCSMVPPL